MSKDSPTFDEKLSLALLELNLRSLLLGGVACNTYGSTRYSEDVDWWLDPTRGLVAWADSVLDVCERTKESGRLVRLKDRSTLGTFPTMTTPDARNLLVDAAKADRVIRAHGNDGMVDLFFEPNNLSDFEDAWSRSRPWDGCLRVLCPEHLIRTKLDTGRRRDEDDIRFLKEQLAKERNGSTS
ncbi:MAG: hypothetical protein HY360_03060 [Verrucomicrobia bacterium]|nr:hypothetical protein [Verrucomicrobiota bacterium]